MVGFGPSRRCVAPARALRPERAHRPAVPRGRSHRVRTVRRLTLALASRPPPSPLPPLAPRPYPLPCAPRCARCGGRSWHSAAATAAPGPVPHKAEPRGASAYSTAPMTEEEARAAADFRWVPGQTYEESAREAAELLWDLEQGHVVGGVPARAPPGDSQAAPAPEAVEPSAPAPVAGGPSAPVPAAEEPSAPASVVERPSSPAPVAEEPGALAPEAEETGVTARGEDAGEHAPITPPTEAQRARPEPRSKSAPPSGVSPPPEKKPRGFPPSHAKDYSPRSLFFRR